jgi:PHD/YefM family antitoxin component YafN of YafNO toxin-antitoxin module
MAAEDLESLEATIELLSDAAAQARIAEAEADIAQGDVISEGEMRALMEERRRSGR